MKGIVSGVLFYVGVSTVKKTKNGHEYREVYLSKSASSIEEGGEVQIYRWWALVQPTPNLEVNGSASYPDINNFRSSGEFAEHFQSCRMSSLNRGNLITLIDNLITHVLHMMHKSYPHGKPDQKTSVKAEFLKQPC